MGPFSGVWRSALARRRKSSKKPAAKKAARQARLSIEGLEDRTVLSTFFVEPPGFPVDSTHVHTLQDALGAAVPNDTIQIEPGGSTASVGSTVGAATPASTLAAPSLVNATAIAVNNFIPSGEAIQIGTGASQETDLILSTAVSSGGQFVLTLKQPLAMAHVAGERVDTLGQLGIGTSITLQGDTIGGQVSVSAPLVVWNGTANVLIRTLTLKSSLTLQGGSSATTVLNSVLGVVTENASPAGNGGRNLFREDTFTGAVSLTGNPAGTATADQVLNGAFLGGTLTLASDDSSLIQGNAFNDSGNVTAISVTASQNVEIAGNTVTIVNGGGALNGPVGISIGGATAATLSVSLVNNALSTAGAGRGVAIVTPAGAGGTLRVFLQGNDFHFNLIGIADQGDGTSGANSAGIIDAGLGVLGSLGGNNFRQFQAGDASAGNRFAIYIYNTVGAAGSISAQDNLFSVLSPSQVVKDAGDHAAAGAPLPAGTGTITVGTSTQQRSPEQEFVQSLFNDFLGRSGTLDELNGWVAKISMIGRVGVGNSIIHSTEALTRLVDSYYEKYLGRPADSGGEAGWVNFMLNGGTAEQLTANFLGSPEYYDRLKSANNSPDAAYVQSLYNVLFARVGTNSEVGGWLSKLAAGMSRSQVALAFTQSTEYRNLVVNQYYFNLLRRTAAPSSGEINGWAASGFDLLSIAADFTGQDEFFFNG